jgi:hypothetical protein
VRRFYHTIQHKNTPLPQQIWDFYPQGFFRTFDLARQAKPAGSILPERTAAGITTPGLLAGLVDAVRLFYLIEVPYFLE